MARRHESGRAFPGMIITELSSALLIFGAIPHSRGLAASRHGLPIGFGAGIYAVGYASLRRHVVTAATG